MDNTNISASSYQQIWQTNYYYYDSEVSNTTHFISSTDPSVNYSVSFLFVVR